MFPRNAIIKVDGQFRLSIQLFRTQEGFAWLEPDYLIGDGTGSGGFHRLECKLVEDDRGFEFEGPHHSGFVVDCAKIRPGEEIDQVDLYKYIDEYERALAAKGRTRQSETRRMIRFLASELKGPLVLPDDDD